MRFADKVIVSQSLPWISIKWIVHMSDLITVLSVTNPYRMPITSSMGLGFRVSVQH
jgi:hypothetical protein